MRGSPCQSGTPTGTDHSFKGTVIRDCSAAATYADGDVPGATVKALTDRRARDL